ncbi:UNVERIFIED_ORG: hypothetical protein FNL38_102213 [Nocardia globerula]|uniref:Uncharacterized protein n=1 Tax=Nocardia globerula TaxID=1818 RepID=A0A652YSM8_NOCGL|nr:hypothetical protein [Rhodococcus globerulus]NMD61396.1 hypothetical protein [Nocardia globerula]PVX67054.1 hypothetical protein C8E04_4401 [Rhodococcus globerulus]
MSVDEETRIIKRRELTQLANEFAVVRVSLDTSGNGPRLLVEDVETGDRIFLSPLELASLCLATPDDREEWMRVGNYRDERRDRSLGPLRNGSTP